MDLRVPSGWFFLIIGVILVAMGIIEPSLRPPLTTVNVNLLAGAAMAVFGGVLLCLAKLIS